MAEPFESPRPVGDFAYQTLVGTVVPDSEAPARPRRQFGLDLDGTYPFPEESHQKQIEPLQAEGVHVDGGHFLPQEDPDVTTKLVRERLLAGGHSS